MLVVLTTTGIVRAIEPASDAGCVALETFVKPTARPFVFTVPGGGLDPTMVDYLVTRPRDKPDTVLTLFGFSDTGASNKAAGATRNADASVRRASKVGLAAPVSRRDIYVRKNPACSASCSCVIPWAARNSLIRNPSAIRGVSRLTPRSWLVYTHSYTH